MTPAVYHGIMAKADGFTLIEVLMIIAMISILAVGSMTLMSADINQARYDTTLKHMLEIRTAIVGEENGGPSGTRFGYLGDVGSFPRSGDGIQALLSQPPDVIPWLVNPKVRFGSGWNGPYLPDSKVFPVDYTKDEWGNAFVYEGESDPATLMSYGADGTSGGTGFDSDLTLTIPSALRYATVHGLIQRDGKPWPGNADVEINFPDGGGGKITRQVYTISPSNPGAFLFYKIPVGERSIRILIPDQGSATSVLGPFLVRVDRPHVAISLTAP